MDIFLRHPAQNENGSALISVMIASAIGVIVVLGMMAISDHSFKVQRSLATGSEVENTHNLLRQFLANSTVCSYNLLTDETSGSPIATSPPTSSGHIRLTKVRSPNGNVIISSTTPQLGITITSVEVRPYNDDDTVSHISANVMMAEMMVGYVRGGEILGAKNLNRTIPLTLILDPVTNHILNCAAATLSAQDIKVFLAGEGVCPDNQREIGHSPDGSLACAPIANAAACSAGMAITAINADGSVVCGTAPGGARTPATVTGGDCPPSVVCSDTHEAVPGSLTSGPRVIGINSDGSPKCAPQMSVDCNPASNGGSGGDGGGGGGDG